MKRREKDGRRMGSLRKESGRRGKGKERARENDKPLKWACAYLLKCSCARLSKACRPAFDTHRLCSPVLDLLKGHTGAG